MVDYKSSADILLIVGKSVKTRMVALAYDEKSNLWIPVRNVLLDSFDSLNRAYGSPNQPNLFIEDHAILTVTDTVAIEEDVFR